MRAALIGSLAQTQVLTRSSPRTHPGSGPEQPPNEVAFPNDRSMAPRAAYSARPKLPCSRAMARSRWGLW
jgi:hypothetical protein